MHALLNCFFSLRYGVIFSSDRHSLFSGDEDGVVYQWDVTRKLTVRPGRPAAR